MLSVVANQLNQLEQTTVKVAPIDTKPIQAILSESERLSDKSKYLPNQIVGALIVVPLLLALSVVVAWKQYDKAE